MTERRANMISGSVIFLFALYMAYESSLLPARSLEAGLGPGFLPFWLALTLAALSLALVIKSVVEPDKPLETWSEPEPGGTRRIMFILGAIFVYGLLLEVAGFVLTTMAFIAFLLMVLERHRWPLIVAVSLITSVGTYAFFVGYLKVPLPSGLLGIFF